MSLRMRLEWKELKKITQDFWKNTSLGVESKSGRRCLLWHWRRVGKKRSGRRTNLSKRTASVLRREWLNSLQHTCACPTAQQLGNTVIAQRKLSGAVTMTASCWSFSTATAVAALGLCSWKDKASWHLRKRTAAAQEKLFTRVIHQRAFHSKGHLWFKKFFLPKCSSSNWNHEDVGSDGRGVVQTQTSLFNPWPALF